MPTGHASGTQTAKPWPTGIWLEIPLRGRRDTQRVVKRDIEDWKAKQVPAEEESPGSGPSHTKILIE